jgi:alkyldihydroxyacetonephosphate synthase
MPISRPTERCPDGSWSGWGDPTQAPTLPDSVLSLLRDALGVKAPGHVPGAIDELLLPAPRITRDARAALVAALGDSSVRDDAGWRVRHTRGKSTPDLLRLRTGDMSDAPDLVLLPADHEQVLAVLEICTEHRVAVVPFGGGTSVVGGLAPDAGEFAGMVALDVRRLDALLELDEESRIAVLEPGLRGPEAEALLAASGYTIGHHPQSFEYATIGGYAAARSSGQASAGYGRFDELVMGLRIATPTGSLNLGRAPKSAAGPDLRQLFLGSEGALGVITAVTVAVRPVPEARIYEGWRFASFAAGRDCLRRLAQDGPVPTVVRLSDEAETAINLARPAELGGEAPGGSLAIIGFEGAAGEVAQRREQVTGILRAAGAEPDLAAGEGWADDRYRGPYLRDALLDAGALVETLETVTFWSGLPRLYADVSAALRDSLTAQGAPPVILCHVSHVYRAGASLYFTIGCAALENPVEQWRAAKAATSDAILAAGASITHHHGIGTDHRAWYAQEIGPLGVEILRGVKQTLDPAGILNPGVLIP